MKKILLSFFVIALSTSAFAQKVKDERTSFVYIRLPYNPLDKSIKFYDGEVTLTYKDQVQQKKDAFIASLMDSMNIYQQQLDNFHNANARQTSSATSAATSSSNILLTNRPKAPKLSPPQYIQQLYDEKAFSSQYISLSGYTKGGTTPIKIHVTVSGFEFQPPFLQSAERSNKLPDGTIQKIPYYYYQVKYRCPIHVKLEHKGAVVDEKDLPGFQNWRTAKTISFNTSAECEEYWKWYQTSFLKKLDNQAINANMKALGDELDSQYGFRKVTRATELHVVKAKKFQYPEFEKGYVEAIKGFNALSNSSKKSASVASLKKAISYWDAALAESQPSNKKARINGKVTAAAHCNIAQAAIFADDFVKAEEHISKASIMKYNKYEKIAASLKRLLNEQRARYEANNK